MAWRKILTLSVLSAGLAVGCVVTATDGDPDDGDTDSGTGGGGNTGGGDSGSGGGTDAGTGGSGGGSDSGSGGATTDANNTPAYECKPNDATASECQKCIDAKCCDVMAACAANDTCFYTTADGGTDGEWPCIEACVADKIATDGFIDTDGIASCGMGCSVQSTLDWDTEDLTDCIMNGSSAATDAGIDAGGAGSCKYECYGL